MRRPVAAVVSEHLPATLALAALAMPAGLIGGTALGLLLGLAPRRRWPHWLRAALMAGFAVPGFVVAIVAIQVVAVDWRLLPASGFDSWRALILPASLLAAGFAVRLGLLLQDRLNALASLPFVRFAAAKGLARGVVVRRHLLRPAASLALGYAFLQLGYLLGGALVVESVFAIPGLGRLAVLALAHRDLPLLQGCLAVAGCGFLAVRMLADLAHAAIDPRPSLAAPRG
jgi:ABC-type dipeptide/oligopeptide/nickel transport system permease component